MARLTRVTALFTVVAVFAAWTGAFAADPTQADFDACNKEAQAASGTPAASPGTSTPSASGSVSAPGASASGSVSTSPSPTPSTSPSTTTPGPSVSGGTGTTDTASDPLLRGIAAAGQTDAAYQQAYKDCMKRRGF